MLNNARGLLRTASAENVVNEKGKIKYTIVQLDHSRTKEYLESKHKELQKNYLQIKGYLKEGNVHYCDSLFVLAFVNDIMYFYSANSFEDRCKYIRIIRNSSECALSEWTLNEFFGPLLNIEDTIKAYLNMEYDAKYERVYKTLMVPEKEGEEKCR